ncbi:MAG: diguanylate cyclase [Enterobacterales bacterium]|nr:diguanylate cyclase [Enterobacterales bacterium]
MESKHVQISFRAQLILMMVAIVSIMLLLVALYLQYRVNPILNDKLVDDYKQKVRVVSRKSVQAVLEASNTSANKVLQKYRQDPTVEVATILLADGSLLGLYSKVDDSPLPSVDITTPLIQTKDALKIIEPIYFKKDQIIGYLYVQFNSQSLASPKNDYVWFLFALALLMLSLSFLLSNFFQGKLTKPIRLMVRHIANMYESKKFDKRLVAIRDDEIGKLVNGFNQLLDATQERENELTAKSSQLQKLVDVRTKQLFQKAHYDSLTGLPNRYLLVDRLRQAISQSNRSNSFLALLFLDLDRFKIINDNFGHQNGDLLLKEVAKRLKNISRKGDTIARLGGDEFVFLLENMTQAKDAARSALKIIECFNEPFRLQDHVLHISTSIGISIYPSDGKDDKQLLKNADISMYHAKKKGAGKFQLLL